VERSKRVPVGEYAAKQPDHWQFGLLPARRERPNGRRAAEKRYELAPLDIRRGDFLPYALLARQPTRALGFSGTSACHREAGKSLGQT